jgi:hypothetical protein
MMHSRGKHMTGAEHTMPVTLESKLETLEHEGAEKLKALMDDLKIELREIKEEHGRDVVLAKLSNFHTLNQLRAFVEDLPNTAKDDALAVLKAGMPVGPRTN